MYVWFSVASNDVVHRRFTDDQIQFPTSFRPATQQDKTASRPLLLLQFPQHPLSFPTPNRSGFSSIRVYGESTRFITSLENRLDYNTIALIMEQLAAQWLAIRLGFIGALISFFIAVVAVATNGFLPASYLALGLTYSFQITTYLKFTVGACNQKVYFRKCLLSLYN